MGDPNALGYGGDRVVRVRNVGEEDFVDGWNNVKYVIKAGEDAFVPSDAALSWFGDNALFNLDARNKPREKEVQRLRVKYGVYNDHDTWDSKTPFVEVYNLRGERIYTLIEDIDGDRAAAEAAADSNPSSDAITDRMQALERELKTLQSALATQDAERRAAESAIVDGEDDGEDEDPADNGEDAEGGDAKSVAAKDGPATPSKSSAKVATAKPVPPASPNTPPAAIKDGPGN